MSPKQPRGRVGVGAGGQVAITPKSIFEVKTQGGLSGLTSKHDAGKGFGQTLLPHQQARSTNG